MALAALSITPKKVLGFVTTRSTAMNFYFETEYPSDLELPDRSRLEISADRFALSLLMPRHELKSFSDAGVNTLMTTWAFDVSETALLNRLHWLESDSLTTNRQPSEFFRNLLK